MQNIARHNSGKCLSDKYLGCYIKLKWKCKKGHIWFAQPNSIKNQKSWCPVCKGIKLSKLFKGKKLK